MPIADQWTAFCTIVIKEVGRFMRIWRQTLIPPVMTTVLYFVVFGNLIGKRVGQMDGFDYMDFIVPGLILMSVIQHSYQNVVSSFFSAKFQRSLEEMLVSPMPAYVILAGYVVGGMTRGILTGAIVTVVSLAFTDVEIHNVLVLVSVVLLTSLLFALAGLLNGIFARTFDDVNLVPTFILTPLTYLGGIFYSIKLLPGFWQDVSLINPILYMINAFRYGFLGISDIGLSTSYALIFAFIFLFASIALYALHRGYRIRS